MKHLLSVSVKFYKNNGLFGICSNKIKQLRGGADEFGRIPHTNVFSENSSSNSKAPLTAEQLDEILNDNQISEWQKTPFRNLREDPMFGDFEKLKIDKLRKSLIAKSKRPNYNKIKGKVPYVLLSPFTLGELARLGAYRAAGYISAPFTIGSFIGFSMPCAVTFAMLEMYVPDKFKRPCKWAKWSGGLVFFGVCAGVDYFTSGLETKVFGQPFPLDAPTLMGTLPEKNDFDDLRKMKEFGDSLFQKSNSLPTLDLDKLGTLGED